MKKTYLLTPGPTPVPEVVLASFARPLIHHRTPEFQKLFEEVKSALKRFFQTENDVMILASTGTGAMDAVVSNLFSPGDTVLTLNAGKFGERWTEICRAYQANVIEIVVKPGDTISIEQVRIAVKANPTLKAILFQASETSTGVVLPTREICELARTHGLVSICDAVTACGVFSLPMDAWGIDVMITGSQKALMLPPGLSFVALSERAWKLEESSRNPHFYFDLRKEKNASAKNQTAWTPATSLIQGLSESLKLIEAEGYEELYARHERLARATRAGVDAIKLKRLGLDCPSPAVTAVWVPKEIVDGKKIVKTLRDRYGIAIAGGQNGLEGKIFRLSHFGYCSEFDVVTALSGLELVLNELGYSVKFGTAVGAALEVFHQATVV